MPHTLPSTSLKWNQAGRALNLDIPLECIVRQTSESPQKVIFALHGFGDNARNFSELADEFKLPDTLWVFLQAPERLPFPGDGGQWYELFGNPHPQFKSSCEKVRITLESFKAQSGLDWKNIFLFGFSQGSFVSLHSGLTLPHRLGGVVALSGYLAHTHRLTPPAPERLELPIFLAHGLNDQVVFPAQHFETLDILSHFGFRKVTAKTYRGVAHGLCAEEIFDIRSFFEGIS
ncbi:MAG: alpha/beta hydrolase [Silvanigrellaceae bacterium]